MCTGRGGQKPEDDANVLLCCSLRESLDTCSLTEPRAWLVSMPSEPHHCLPQYWSYTSVHMIPGVLDEIVHLNSGPHICPPSLLIHGASPRPQLPMKHTYKLGKNRQSQVGHQ